MAPLATLEQVVWRNQRGFQLGPLDLLIEPGEIVVLVGDNGAGKSTLLRLLAGLWRPTRGSVNWPQVGNARSALSVARVVGYLQQNVPSEVGITVSELVALGRFAHHKADSPVTLSASSHAALEAMGMVGFESSLVDQLSGGERKRVLVAAVLAQQAPLLVLDEPTAHLDPASHRLMASAVRSYVGASAGKRAAVIATHDLHFAQSIATRVLGVRLGEATDLGSPELALTADSLGSLFGTQFVAASEGPPVVDMGRRETSSERQP